MNPTPASLLHGLVGRTLSAVTLVRYAGAAGPTHPTGPVALTFSDGLSVLMKPAADGELLDVTTGGWEDAFAEPLSEEDRAYVRRCGKWTAYDVSSEEQYLSVVGHQVTSIEPMLLAARGMTGVTILTDAGKLTVRVEFDELIAALT